MKTAKELRGLKVGDTFASGKLLPGMCKTVVVWELIEKQVEMLTFHLTFKGVSLGAMTVSFDHNEVPLYREVL